MIKAKSESLLEKQTVAKNTQKDISEAKEYSNEKSGACLSHTQIKLGSNKDMASKQTNKTESKKTLQA